MDATRPSRFFLIRHAETEWNASRIFQGHLDSALTETGARQATELAARLSGEGIGIIYSSDQGRSMRTAEAVASRLGLTPIHSADLREIDCGEWTGRSYGEVRARWPEQFDSWRNRPDHHQMPRGESVSQVQQRSLRFLEEVLSRHGGATVCAITHNTVVRAILCHLQGWPLSRLWDGARQPNCAVNLIEFHGGQVHLIEIASTNHLTSRSVDGLSV